MLKRTVAALLTLMLAVMLLPKAALAYDVTPDPNPNNSTISIDYIDGVLQRNYGTVSSNKGTVTDNYGVVASNKGTVTNNYGNVTNIGTFSAGQIMNFGTITHNHNAVYNNKGRVENNGKADGTLPGVVYNDHGRVDWNYANSTVYNYCGRVWDNTGVIYNYGDGFGTAVPGYTNDIRQYWEVTVTGTSAANVTVGGLTDKIFGKYWVYEDDAVTLIPESGFYFSSPPLVTNGNVVPDGASYKVRNISSDTEITINGLSAVTNVSFSGLSANGGDTETTSVLTLTFDKAVAGLSADDFTVTGATKGALTAGGSGGVYTLAVSNVSVADHGSVSVAVQKHGFAFSPSNRNVQVRRFTPPTISLTPSGSTRFVQGAAAEDAVFTVTSSSAVLPLSAANFASATLAGNALHLGIPDGDAGTDGSVKSGSVIVTVKQGTLNALPPGDHRLIVTLQGPVYGGRTVEGVIAVTAPGAGGTSVSEGVEADIPKTGDNAPVLLLLSALLLAGAALVIRRVRRKEG